MNTVCPACSHSLTPFVEQDSYSFKKCPNCGLFLVAPMPTDEELAIVYSPKAGYQGHKLKKDYKKEINYKYQKIFSQLKKYSVTGKVLDVGTSDGEFLYYAKNAGFEVAGVEPNQTTAEIANQNELNVFCGFLAEAPFLKYSFNVLRLGDVLEHSNHPQKLIEECKSFLMPGGYLIISIPNMDSNWAKSTFFLKKFFNLPWSVLTPPHHLLYFSKNNLDLFMNQTGFSLVETWYHRPPTLKYELGSTHLLGKFKREKTVTNFLRFVFGVSLYTLLYLVDFLLTPFKSKDFGMLTIYKKNA